MYICYFFYFNKIAWFLAVLCHLEVRRKKFRIYRCHPVYCPMIKVDWLTSGVFLRELAHRLQILPANEKLGLVEADEVSDQ